MNSFQPAYPVDALPPLLAGAVTELCQQCQVPAELAAPLVVGVASLACQGAVDVARPNCQPSPTLLYTVVVSGSGTRKTAVTIKALSSVFELEHELSLEAANRMPEYEAALLAWEVEKKYLLSEIERQAKKNEGTSALHERLTRHIGIRPQKPTAPKFIYEDPTPEAVVEGLCKTWHSAAVVSSEGGGFLNGRPSSDLPMWNKLWDGAGIGAERIGRGAMSARDARGGLILAIQEGQFEEFRDARGAQAMDIGFLARVLFSRPPRNIGSRFICRDQQAPSWTSLESFKDRIKGMLRAQAEEGAKGNTARTTLKFSPQAEQRWVDAFNEVESLMQLGKCFHAIPGYASKIPENIARVAAIFHHFEGNEGDIEAGAVDGAIRICQWHANEFLDCFGPPAQIPLEYRDAETLEKWLLNYVWNVGHCEVRKNDIRQSGPDQLRNKIRLENACRVLIVQGRVRIANGINRTRFVQLNPEYFRTLAWISNVSP